MGVGRKNTSNKEISLAPFWWDKACVVFVRLTQMVKNTGK